MSTCKTIRMIVALTALFAGSHSALAGVIVNGDFATGDFSGWTVSASNDSGDPIVPDPFTNVLPFGAGNAAQLETGEFADGLFIATLEQTFTVSAAEPIFSFEFTLLDSVPDSTGTGAGPFPDSFFVSVDDGFSFFDLLLVDDAGPLADPFGTAPGDVSLGAAQDAAFDFRFDADLSSLAGSSVTLFVDLFSEDDLFQSTILTSHFMMEEDKPTSEVVPEPSAFALWSILCVTAVGGRVRRKRSAAGRLASDTQLA